MIRIHYFLHVPFEGPGNIGSWTRDRGHTSTSTRFYKNDRLPALDSFDWLVLMGGPMNVYDHDVYPWLVAEKTFLEKAIADGKYVLGICLGGQLAADVLGGRVERNFHREIGWHPITLTEAGRRSPLFTGLPSSFDVFQWHGDTFSIPLGAENLATSSACTNQAFQYRNHVFGMQFHLDYSIDSIQQMLHHCAKDLTDEPYVQSTESIRASLERVKMTSDLLTQVFNNLENQWLGQHGQVT
ncbi:MAG: type 1 glutamine amidotransferase [Pirellulales bacterium]|nr:type 1 glutamine amidotransferase [Pirellulales bacterium]